MKINVQNISLAYGERQLFEGVSYCFEQGRIYRLTGPSGCGKSSFLRLLCRLHDADSGAITFEGVETLAIPQLRRRVQLLPQVPVMFTGTVEEKFNAAF